MASSSDKPNTPQLLVIEDEREAAEYLKGYFQQFGLEVAVALSAQEGMSLLSALKPRVVLLDLRLGSGMDGLDILERIRPAQGGPEVVVVTAVGDSNVAERAKGLGACAYVTKPFVMEELERTVLSRFRE